METFKKEIIESLNPTKAGFVNRLLAEGWTYIKTVVDVDIKHGAILILDRDLRVIAVSESFYQMFQVESKEVEGKFIYKILENKLDVPLLRRLLEDIIPHDTFFNSFEVVGKFPIIGIKTMILNARQIYLKEKTDKKRPSPMIFLAMEDVTEMMAVAESLALHTSKLENKITKYTEKLENNIKKLEKEIKGLKIKVSS